MARSTWVGLNGRVDALVSVPHHGAIPDSVYAGGVFTSAGGITSAVTVARWDGSAWHSIGAPPISHAIGAAVDAIAVDPQTGKVYVGGFFTIAGGNPNADFLAVWDGASWKSFCAPITANVKALRIIGRLCGPHGKRALKPGAYKATLKARNAKGGAKPVTVRFSIVR